MATLSRAEALKIITEVFPTEPAIVTLGATVRELIGTVGRRDNDFYVLDSMGLPVAIGLGIALGRPDNPEKIVVIEGDGGLADGPLGAADGRAPEAEEPRHPHPR